MPKRIVDLIEKYYLDPRFALLVTILAIFLGELIVMIALDKFCDLPTFIESIVDAIVLSVIVAPIVYGLCVRPLQKAVLEIKELQKLIPICSCCKKIRSDSGYWHRLEEYLGQYSITFTHSYCTECADKLKQDYAEYMRSKE